MTIILGLCILSSLQAILPQQADTLYFTLDQAIEIAIHQSPAALRSATLKETSFWQWKTYKSNYLPQLSMSGQLSDYTRDNIPVLQPDGSTEFLPVNNNYSSFGISLNQAIAGTGASVYINSNLARFDNLESNLKSYSAKAVSIGISQPIFGYNRLAWDKRIEPLKYEESQKRFIEEKEEISFETTIRYFELLIAQIGYQIAQNNLSNNEFLLEVANTRYEMGKITRDNLMQLQLSVVNAKKAMSYANLTKKTTTLELLAFMGYAFLGYRQPLILELPSDIQPFKIDEETALTEALKNRSDATSFQRRLIESDSRLRKAKAENGFNADLFIALGLANSDRNINELYGTFQNKQNISVGFNMPIVDWGRAKSKIRTAELLKELEEQSVNLEMDNFKLQIITEVEQFELYKEQLIITSEASNLTDMRYEISMNKFILGNETATDLNIALNEKDMAILDYILALKNCWLAYFRMRQLTLYDFETNSSLLNIH